MKIIRADLYKLAIPFNFVFAHATAERERSENVILRLTLDSEIVGYGECLARPYVTGETANDVCGRFEREYLSLLASLRIDHAGEFIRFMHGGDSGLPEGASGCLLELALLDAFGKAFGITIPEVFNRPRQRHCAYAGVLGNMSPFLRTQILRRMKDAGLGRVKVKVGFGDSDRDVLRECREILGPEVAIGLDANAAWTPEQAVEWIRAFTEFGVDFVEQPVGRDDREGAAYVTRESPVDIVLDETVCTIQDADVAIRDRLCHGFNVRLAKVGGFARALRMHDLAHANGLRYHVGALVGETGILAAAGRHLAAMTSPRTVEGSFGDLLLTEDVTIPSVKFGRQGIGESIDGVGLGVVVSPERIERHQALHRSFVL